MKIVKEGLGVDLQLLTNREKALVVDALKELYALPELLAQLELARSSYFYHRARVKVVDKYLAVRRSITDIFELNHRCYGYRGSVTRSSFARCLARGARLTTRRAKASSAG